MKFRPFETQAESKLVNTNINLLASLSRGFSSASIRNWSTWPTAAACNEGDSEEGTGADTGGGGVATSSTNSGGGIFLDEEEEASKRLMLSSKSASSHESGGPLTPSEPSIAHGIREGGGRGQRENFRG